jgi:CNP1-like family
MMNFERAPKACSWLLLSLLAANLASAQVFADPADWKESDVPPPPAYDMSKLLTFEVTRSSPLVYGVDPASFSISQGDGIVRYVVVATSAAGAKNVIYEGFRCSTGEVRTYARAKPDGTWVPVVNSEWKSAFDISLPRHSLRFAKAAACQNAAPVKNVAELVRRLKSPSVE